MANYGHRESSYRTPPFALHMGTTLQQCYKLPSVHALKKSNAIPNVHSANLEVGLKTLIQLMDVNWRFDVSNQAASDFNLRKWDKINIVPLATAAYLKIFLLRRTRRKFRR